MNIPRPYLFACLFVYLLPHSLACGILIPRPENEPMTPALGAWSLSHWTAREDLGLTYFIWKSILELGRSDTHDWGTPVTVQFSRSVVFDSLRPHGLQHARLPCPSPTPGACSNSCPSSQWCHPTIWSSVIPLPSRFQSFPASGGLFKWVSSLHQVAKGLADQLQH